MTTDLASLRHLLSQRLVGAWRICFQHRGVTDVSRGALELEFEGAQVVHLTGCGDGERLSISDARWVDAFAEPLSPENSRFVEECGKHVRVYCDATEVPVPLHSRLLRYRPILNQFGTLAGVVLDFDTDSIRFLVECDEDYVMASGDTRFTSWGFRTGEWVP